MKLCIQLFLIVALITSCRNHHIKRLKSNSLKTDTLITDVPKWYNRSDLSEKRDAQVLNSLELASLQNGFDSLQIRIWIGCDYKTASSLILFEKARSEWNAVFYWFKIDDDGLMNVKAKDIHAENRSPKSGWNIFCKNLIQTGIIDLPDETKFDKGKFFRPFDGNGVTVEIGMRHKFRVYGYPELGFNSHIKEGPWKLHRALKLIESEFGYKRPCQDSAHIQ